VIRDGLERAVDAVTEHNRITLLVMVVLTGAVVAGIPMLDTESQAGASIDSFDDLDRVQKAQYIEENYGQQAETNTTLSKVYVRNESGDVLSKASLLDGLRYQQSVRGNETVYGALHGDGIVGISNLVATRTAGTTNPDLETQVEALESATPSEVERLVGATLADDPRAQRFLPSDHDPRAASADDRRMLVTLNADAPDETLSEATAVIHETAKGQSGNEFFTLGSHARGEYNSHFSTQMMQLVVPAALLLILFVLLFAYRDLVDVVVGMTGVVLSVAWMFGIMGWLGVAAGTISIIPVVLITGLSVDFGFHVFNRYREERGDDDGIRGPMNRGVRHVSTALILVTLTAAIGFLANLANPLPVIRNLGVSITLGVVSALVLFTTVVPALKISVDGLLERFGFDRGKRALGHGRYLEPALKTSVTVARRAAPLVLVIAVAGAAAGGLVWTDLDQEQFGGSDADIAEWKQQLPGPMGWETHEYQDRSNHVDEAYKPASATDSMRSTILVEQAVTSDDALEDLHAGTAELERDGVVLETADTPIRSPVTAMQAVARQDGAFAATFESADTDGDGVPDRNIEALYDAFYEANSDVASQVVERGDGEYRSLLVTVTLDTNDWADRSSYVATLETGASTMADGGERSATVAGSFAVNQSILDEVQAGILMTMIIALAAVVAAMALVFRLMHGSGTLGVVVAVPIILVVGLVIGGMRLLGIPLNLLTALLMSLVIGLGIDYNIHLGDRFADERRAGAETYEALETAVTGTGGALLGSTLTSVCAFATLLLVPNSGIQSFGTIVVTALLTAFVASVFVLPSLLVLWSRVIPSGVSTRDSQDQPADAREGMPAQD
jgi:predicted RND superfamily exporter protein